MNSDDLLDMAGNSRFISVIYNYCDRWCERCAFTGRCLTYASGRGSTNDEPGYPHTF
jgi:hypothetical protein